MLIFVALGMAYRTLAGGGGLMQRTAGARWWQGAFPEQPSTRTMVRYLLLIFGLGILIWIFPDSTRRF